VKNPSPLSRTIPAVTLHLFAIRWCRNR